MRPLGFGEIVDGAVQLYRRDFGLYYLIALLCSLPDYVLLVLWNPAELLEGMQAVESTEDPTLILEQFGAMSGSFGLMLLILLVGMFFAWYAALSITVAMADRIEDRPSSIGAALRGAIPRMPSAAGASIVALAAFVIVQVVVGVALAIVSVGVTLAATSPWVIVAVMATILGVTVLVTLLCIAAVFGVFPAVVIEGRPAIDALSRSLALCRAGWLRVIGIMVVALIVYSAPPMALQTLTGTWELFLSPGEVATISATRQWVINTADLVIGPLTVPFLVGCMMVLFHDRRVRSEGYDLERLADEMESGSR